MQLLAVTIPLLMIQLLFPLAAAQCTSSGAIDKVHLVGLLETNPTSTCDRSEPVYTYGLSLALAMEYIIDIVNSSNTELSVDGVQYEFQLESLCTNRSLATRSTAVNIPKTVWTEQSVCFNQSSVDHDSLLLGFIGPSYSSNAKYVAQFLNNTNIPVITPSATLAELSDKTQYHSFLRTAISDDKQGKAIIDVAIKMEWSYILLIHTDDDYGRQGSQTIKHYGELNGICFSDVIEVQLDPSNRNTHHENISKQMKADQAMAIIYFGTETTAQAIIENYLNLVSESSVVNRKVILASEGVGTYPGILDSLEPNNNKLGLLTLAPYNTGINLHTYIQQRIDKTKTGIPATNQLVEQFVSECGNKVGCDQSQLSMATDATQQTLESVVSMLHAFKETHTEFCKGNPGVCLDLSNSPAFYSSMLKSLFDSAVNVSIGEMNIAVDFDAEGELDKATKTPAFTLNLATKSSNTWSFDRVALYYHNESWVYSGASLLTPDYGSRCTVNCEVCQKQAAPYIYRRNEKSPYIIAGTAAVNDELDQHNCGQKVTPNGFVMMESFYYAVEQIQNITGMQFSTLFIDTCYAQLGTHAIMNDIFREENKAYLTDSSGVEWPISPTDFVVFIGDASSGISLVLQTYLNLYNIPQISYRSTSIWLSDSLRYPMFLRNVPTDDEQARLMIEIVELNNWTDIGLIQSDSVYGQTGGDLVMKYANQAGICISYHKTVKNTEESIAELAQDTKQAARNNRLPTVIIFFAEEGVIADFLQKIQAIDSSWIERENVLIGSETWNKLDGVIEGVEEFVYGSLTFSFSDTTYSWTVGDDNDFQRFLDTQKPETNQDNPLFIHFWQQYFDCYLLQDSLPSSEKKCEQSLSLAYTSDVSKRLDYEDVVGKHVLMAGLSVAYAVREAVYGERKCMEQGDGFNCSYLFDTADGRLDFFRYLQETKIPQQIHSDSKTYSPYLPSGDGRVNYKVYNIRKHGNAASYQTSYEITDGTIVETSPPQFYSNGELDGVDPPPSECNSNCQCLNEPLTAPQPSTTSPMDNLVWEPPSWLLPLLVLIIVFLVILLVAVVGYILIARRTTAQRNNRYDQLPMQRLSREELPPTPAPEPTTIRSMPSGHSGQQMDNSYVREPRPTPSTRSNTNVSQRQSPDEYLQFNPSNMYNGSVQRPITMDTDHYEVPDSFSLRLQDSSSGSHQHSTSAAPTQPKFFNPDPKAGVLNERMDSNSTNRWPARGPSGRRSPPGEESSQSNSLSTSSSASNHSQPHMDRVKTVD